MSTTKNFLNKKVIIVVAVLAVGVLSAVLVASSLAQATAQEAAAANVDEFRGRNAPNKWLSEPCK
jgi:hypothetical protein